MKKLTPRSPLSKITLLQNYQTPNDPSKPKLKIPTQKFPCGFFSSPQNPTPTPSPYTSRSTLHLAQNIPKLPEFCPKQQHQDYSCKTAASSRIQVTSEDEMKSNDEDLLIGLINSTRNMRRMIRKHSLEQGKGSQGKDGDRGKEEVLQLPPLKQGRGKFTCGI